jgi:type I site-specific restriction endonuclease
VDARNIRNIVLMRPINSVIEFKQIVGRGTRLYDSKEYGSPPSTLTDHVNSRAVLVLKCLTINELRRSISEMEGR